MGPEDTAFLVQQRLQPHADTLTGAPSVSRFRGEQPTERASGLASGTCQRHVPAGRARDRLGIGLSERSDVVQP